MKRLGFAIAAVLCLAAAAVLVIKAIPAKKEAPPVAPPVTQPVQRVPEEEPEPQPYVSPVDFAALQEECADAYAWLSIPGTDISYPVVQHPTQDEYYLNRDIHGQSSADGSLFTQAKYNGLTFEDPVTIIYGHRRNNGAMFGQLQPLYLGDKDFSAVNEFVVFLPDRELHYRIFAAVPHSNEHILYYHDFTDKAVYQEFLDEIYAETDSAANFDAEAFADAQDKIVILSTCLQTNRTRRFLVMGKLTGTVDTGEAPS